MLDTVKYESLTDEAERVGLCRQHIADFIHETSIQTGNLSEENAKCARGHILILVLSWVFATLLSNGHKRENLLQVVNDVLDQMQIPHSTGEEVGVVERIGDG